MDSILQKGGGGTGSDECTATAAMVLAGYKAVTADSDGEAVEGTLDVQSILSFKCAPYSAKAITFVWQNPVKGAFSGIIIVGKEGGYPTGITDGTECYRGYGSNPEASGISSVTVDVFKPGIKYYFTAFSYALKNDEDWISSKSWTDMATTFSDLIEFKESGEFVVPPNVERMDVFLVGGGSSGNGYPGSNASNQFGGGGGGGGKTLTVSNLQANEGDVFPVRVGSGGARILGVNMNPGGISSFGNYTVSGGTDNNGITGGGNGGSGGGHGGEYQWNRPSWYPSAGGSNGSDGQMNGSTGYGKGQKTTTRAFGEPDGELYAAGGGGGYRGTPAGGAGGGGTGGGGNAVENTGSGGGGSSGGMSGSGGGKGGDGIVIVRIKFKEVIKP